MINEQTNKRRYIKMQKFPIFVTKSLNINILKTRNIVKLQIIVITQVNTEVLHMVYVI